MRRSWVDLFSTDLMESAFNEATMEVENDIIKEREDRQKKLEQLWNKMVDNYDSENPELMDKLNEEWLGIMNDWNKDMFNDHWQSANDIEEMQYSNMKKTYQFEQNNKYLESEGAHRLFLDNIKEGNTTEAIFSLEAHLKNHPNDHLGWNMLGGLLQENDQDQKSVTAYLQALKVKPDCMQSLLQLGIGCTNILDETHSNMYLHRWLRSHPKFHSYAGNQLIDETRVIMGDFSAEELLAVNAIMVERFQEARANGGNDDPDFCMAFGVVAFIAREYKLAVELMNRTVELDPMNYSAWNKLGACLAQLDETEMGRMSYRKALDLKPNYVRPWVNLGMTYSAKRDYETSMSYHLNALSLNPHINHVWSYVEGNLACLHQFDLIPLLKHKNPKIFGPRFEVVTVKDLPQPEGSDCKHIVTIDTSMLEKYSLKEPIEGWVKSIEPNTSNN